MLPIQQILLSVLSSYFRIFAPLGTVIYFSIVVYSLYCDLKGVDNNNTRNTSERPVITVLPPSSNKSAGAPFIQPVFQQRTPPTNTLPQAPHYEADVTPASAERSDRTESYYSIPESK
jgi:hypothetical protein